jgi:homoserine kinase type II
MAVHTPLSRQQIVDFIAPFQLGELLSFSGIADGMENTNYCITIQSSTNATNSDYILTLFENLTIVDVAFYLQLMAHLAENGLPVPQPLSQPSSEQTKSLTSIVAMMLGKPAALLNKLTGSHPTNVNAEQCFAVGKLLAQQHVLTREITARNTNHLDTILTQGQHLSVSMQIDEQHLLLTEIQRARQFLSNTILPNGIIHGDLFRDNVLFDGNVVTGLLDYYNATQAPLLLDLAIVANDWCNTENYQLDTLRVTALLNGYQTIRPLQDEELAQWPNSLCVAALRFWLSRLLYQQAQIAAADGAHFPQKDPDEFRQKLICRRQLIQP